VCDLQVNAPIEICYARACATKFIGLLLREVFEKAEA